MQDAPALDGSSAVFAPGVADARPEADPATDAAGDSLSPDTTGTAVREGGAPPLDVEPGPSLWLTADKGLVCASNRVVTWADQSGNQRDAALRNGQLGPQCNLATPHLINGVDVPYFSAPVSASNPNVVDETLDVDLSFLLESAYTIFVVERRLVDFAPGTSSRALAILGTTIADEGDLVCAPDTALALSYVYYYGGPQLALEHNCNGMYLDVAAVREPPKVNEETALFDLAAGRRLWINGQFVPTNDVNMVPLWRASGGAIGRAIVQTTKTGSDWRFVGDIAEIIVYPSALLPTDREAVERYLQAHWQY